MTTVRCGICPKSCRIAPGEKGECRVRANLDGRLLALTYGRLCSANVMDPVEKKPLYHFLPGTRVLSVATVGCNLHCLNCQNWQISQTDPEDAGEILEMDPASLVQIARQENCPSIAYTYTEPVVYYEFTLDGAREARKAGVKNILVTAAYCNPGPWRELCRYVDAANIDLKAFDDDFYRQICSASLKPVLRCLSIARELGVHLEITNLLIPTLNDSDRQITDLCRFIAGELGQTTPVHFSRFHPQYRMTHLPPTPPDTLERAREIARAEGLKHIYIGNLRLSEGGTTRCANCDSVLIERSGYRILSNRLQNDSCPDCQHHLEGIWN